MHTVTAVLVGAALAAASAARASAQDPVTKPPPTSTTTDRLPPPTKITAAQEPDGRIRVVWNAVEGAAKYVLTRSVPNVGSGAVALPNPSDTVYLDPDVKAGFYYYYVVNAVSTSGIAGLKAAATPVNATLSATTATAATPSIAAPTSVWARTDPYPLATLTWQSSQPGVRFIVERAVVSSAGQSPWELGRYPQHLSTVSGGYHRYRDSVSKLPVGTRLVYRVTAVDSAMPTNRSAPAVSNEITTFKWDVSTIVGPAHQLVLTSSTRLADASPFQYLQGTNPRWLSTNESVATIGQDGAVTPRALGVTYIIAIGLAADGVLRQAIMRIEVVPRVF